MAASRRVPPHPGRAGPARDRRAAHRRGRLHPGLPAHLAGRPELRAVRRQPGRRPRAVADRHGVARGDCCSSGCGARPARWRPGSAPSCSRSRRSRSTSRSSARFYALQSLAMFVTAIVVYAAVEAPGEPPLAPAGPARSWPSPPLLLAVYLQPTTPARLRRARALGRRRDRPALAASTRPCPAGASARGCSALARAGASSRSPRCRHRRRWPISGASTAGRRCSTSERSDQFWFYHALVQPALSEPVAADRRCSASFAIAVRPVAGEHGAAPSSPSASCSTRSPASKSLRYIAYAQPFLFVALGHRPRRAVAPAAGLRARGSAARLAGGVPQSWAAGLDGRCPARRGALGFLLLANPPGADGDPARRRHRAARAAPHQLARGPRGAGSPGSTRADIVVTTEELGHLYFLGRYDVRFSPSKLGELATGEQREFGLDHRTGRPVIGTREIAGADPRLLSDRDHRRACGALGPAGADQRRRSRALITARASRWSCRARSQLQAYVWEHPVPAPARRALRRACRSFAGRKSAAE